MRASRDDGRAGKLREGDDARLYAIFRAARTIGSYRNVIAIAKSGNQLDEGLSAAAAGGAANGSNAKMLECAGEQAAIATSADQGTEAGFRPAATNDAPKRHRCGETVMPDRKDDRTGGGGL